jgi:hypothetical protein
LRRPESGDVGGDGTEQTPILLCLLIRALSTGFTEANERLPVERGFEEDHVRRRGDPVEVQR